MTVYNALILNEPYASMVKVRKKTTETRMKMFKYRGDLVICCGATNSTGSNAGKALCIVDFYDGRPMTKEDEIAACIECVEKRIAYPLRNWRYFSYDFAFKDYYISGAYQGIFQIRIPDFVTILTPSKDE